MFLESKFLGNLNYEKFWGFFDVDFVLEVYYCEKCYRVFFNNLDVDICRECGGLWYKVGYIINRVK